MITLIANLNLRLGYFVYIDKRVSHPYSFSEVLYEVILYVLWIGRGNLEILAVLSINSLWHCYHQFHAHAEASGVEPNKIRSRVTKEPSIENIFRILIVWL